MLSSSAAEGDVAATGEAPGWVVAATGGVAAAAAATDGSGMGVGVGTGVDVSAGSGSGSGVRGGAGSGGGTIAVGRGSAVSRTWIGGTNTVAAA